MTNKDVAQATLYARCFDRFLNVAAQVVGSSTLSRDH